MTIRPALVYGAEIWATVESQEKRLEVNEMRIIAWTYGESRKDKIRNKHIRRYVTSVAKKITDKSPMTYFFSKLQFPSNSWQAFELCPGGFRHDGNYCYFYVVHGH